jgi:hypothetical protein
MGGDGMRRRVIGAALTLVGVLAVLFAPVRHLFSIPALPVGPVLLISCGAAGFGLGVIAAAFVRLT